MSMPAPRNEKPSGSPSAVSVPETVLPVILIVDDDYGIRRFVQTFLTGATHARIFAAADASAAVRVVLTIDRPVDLLICDIHLPDGVDGVRLASELACLAPAMKVIMMSGDHAQQSRVRPEWRFLAKPFALASLIQIITPAFGDEENRFAALA